MKLKKNTLYLIGIILFIALAFSVFIFENPAPSPQVIQQGEVQVVKLSVQGPNYVLQPSELKKGIPVRLEADMSAMPGCSKSVVIPAFEVSKSFSTTSNTVEFTPDKSGTFNIACSMNMYKGTFSVVESDGSKTAYVEQSLPETTHTCGGAGGCGCGG